MNPIEIDSKDAAGDEEKTQIFDNNEEEGSYKNISLSEDNVEERKGSKDADNNNNNNCTTSFCYRTFFNTNLKMCMWGTLVIFLGILLTIVIVGYATDDINVITSSSSSKASSLTDDSISTAQDTTKGDTVVGKGGEEEVSIATKAPGATWDDIVCSGKPRGTVFDATFNMNFNGNLQLINVNDAALSFEDTEVSFYYPSVLIGAKVGSIQIEGGIIEAQDELSIPVEGNLDGFTTIAANTIGTIGAVSLGTDGYLTFVNTQNTTNTLETEVRCMLTWEFEEDNAEINCLGGERKGKLRNNQVSS